MREVSRPHLAERTTLKLGGWAIAELWPENFEDWARIPDRARSLGGTPLILGAGSNTLPRDGELPLVLVRTDRASRLEVVGTRKDGGILVAVGAGVRLRRLLGFCAGRGLSGLEGLAGVPGSVGGAVAMNAGSFGTEMCRRLDRVTAVTATGPETAGPEGFQCGYRSFSFGGRTSGFAVVEAVLALVPDAPEAVRERMRGHWMAKKASQPLDVPSAGCVFKNPEGRSAGWLLDQAGFRGRRAGGVCLSERHANFLVNDGKGTATAALELVEEAREAVRGRFGITLEYEVRVVPCSP
ncbi:MAG: UDP-N-acetylmuramate dehydrogenase [Desulfovibrio sp.]|jgi:UDP-N-acetylmuramate dehydrogenase|nr:UDP-N-acetylmuramate dehydrogenase [Desulfovibrio sp.]